MHTNPAYSGNWNRTTQVYLINLLEMIDSYITSCNLRYKARIHLDYESSTL